MAYNRIHQHQIAQQQNSILMAQMDNLNSRLNHLTNIVNNLQVSRANLASDVGNSYCLDASNPFFISIGSISSVSFVPEMMKTQELPEMAERTLLNIQSLANLERLDKEVEILNHMADAYVTLFEQNYNTQKTKLKKAKQFTKYHEDQDANLQICNGYIENPTNFWESINLEL